MMTIPLYQDKTPTEPGQYLWRGAFSSNVELIRVVLYPAKIEHGIHWTAYLGVSSSQRCIEQYIGFFSDELEFNDISQWSYNGGTKD